MASKMKGSVRKFPNLIHVGFDDVLNDDTPYLLVYEEGITTMEPGQRVAIYQLVEEGIVKGPKSFEPLKRGKNGK